MKKKYLIVLIALVVIIIISLVVFYLRESPGGIITKKPSKDKIIAGLTEFYKKDYYPILEKQSTYDCNLQVSVQTSEKVISIDSECTVTSPYAAVEAFLIVLRGDLSTNGGKFYTGLDWDANEKEAVKKRIESVAYSIVASGGEETIEAKEETKNLCFLPCVDDSPPASFEVLKVDYSPDKGELSNLFTDYNWGKFEDLSILSKYSYKLSYKSMERKIEWRYLLGQFEAGKFNLTVSFDKPIKSIVCEREKVKTLTKIPSTECDVAKLDEKTFNIKGFSTGLERLIIKL